jgi:Domain of unknown function (DUF4407)
MLVDGGIQRAADALAAQNTRVTTLAAQVAALRQVEIDPSSSDPQIRQAQQEVSQLVDRKAKADEEVRAAETFASNELGGIKGGAGNSGQPGRGLRYRAALEQLANAKARSREVARDLIAARDRLDGLRKQIPRANDAIKQRSHDQLLTFETAFDAENAKQATLKDELAELTKGRENAIRKSVENAPDHVGYAGGFLAQISALEGIAKEDTKIAGILMLVEIVSFGLELAAVLAKVTSYVPTAYAALLARDAYMRAVRIVDDMMAELKAIDDQGHRQPEILSPEKPDENNQNFGLAPQQDPFGSSGDVPSQPPKRKRGRPRKIS